MTAGTPAASAAGTRAVPWLGVALLIGLTTIWGLNWPLMKMALQEVPPLTFRGATMPVAGLLVLALAKAVGQDIRVPAGVRRSLFLAAMCNVAGWHAFSIVGVAHMTSGRAVVICYTAPLWTAVIARLVLGERLTARRLLALAFGGAGLAALLSGDFLATMRNPVGPLFALGAAILWAAGTLIQKHVVWRMPLLALTGWQLLIGGVPVVLGAAALESPSLSGFSPTVIAIVVYNVLGVLCFCYYAWYKIVSLFPALIASLSTLLIPVTGVVSGALILNEPFGAAEISALVLVCLAIALVVAPAQPATSRGAS